VRPDVTTKTLPFPDLAPPPVTAVISVEDTTLTPVAEICLDAAPFLCLITTDAPEAKPVPVMVMDVPPDVGPDLGETAVTVGAEVPADADSPITAMTALTATTASTTGPYRRCRKRDAGRIGACLPRRP